MKISDREINRENPPYIIAEISANHNGNINHAKRLVEKAKECGADAVKIQTYTADTMTINIDRPDFIIQHGLWKGRSLYDLYNVAQTPFEWQKELFSHARNVGITIFSTPFDETSVDLLTKLKTPAFKVASFEITDIPLLNYVASKRKPIFMSTGMATQRGSLRGS